MGLLAAWLGWSDECSSQVTSRGQRRGGRYTDTRNREILDKLIREKVDDVEILGTK